MDLQKDLNPEQRQAVLHGEGPLLILAGAGSGKTRVITCRIAHLIRERGVAPHQILAVTFTNKAAGEMRERVESLVGKAGGIWISTFHAFGARVLRRHAALLGWGRNFVIYDDDDSKRLGRRVLKELDLNVEQHPVEKMLRHVERQKHKLKNSTVGGTGVYAAFFSRYQRLLKQANAFDFSDLIFQAHKVLSEVPEVLDHYRARFEHVLVDEFQDTDGAQYALLRLLCPRDSNLCVVGDDDQSIYMWRDADISNILGFKKSFPATQVVKLEQNYRSTAVILEAASSVISQNPDRHAKTLWTAEQGGEPIQVEYLEDERDEADTVAREIYRSQERGESLSGMAIFYRVNALSRALEEALRLYGLPYVVVGGTRFFDRLEVKDLLGYLRLMHNPRSDLDLLRVINVPARGIGKVSTEKLGEIATKNDTSMFEVLEPDMLANMKKRAREKLLAFRALIDDLRNKAEGLPADTVIEMVMHRSGYLAALEDQATETALGRVENLRELVTAAVEYGSMSGDASLEGFLEHVALVTDVDTSDASAELVSLMTLHAAKGLEFDTVFMVGLEEGLLPHARSIRPDAEGLLPPGGHQEERRLCYVGMTRARKRLTLLCARRRMIFGRTEMNPPSRFLAELGDLACEQDLSQIQKPVRRPGRKPEPDWDDDVVDMMDVDLDDGDDIVVDYSDEFVQDREAAVRPVEAFSWVGREVEHATFGAGRVMDAQRTGRGVRLQIHFESVGRKTVYSNYVRTVV